MYVIPHELRSYTHIYTYTHIHIENYIWNPGDCNSRTQSSSVSRYYSCQMNYLTPLKKLLGSGVSTPYTPFCLICTTSSTLTCISHLHPIWLSLCWYPPVSRDGFDTRWIPRSFPCGKQYSFYINDTFILTYGAATVSRIDKIISLFCRISSLL